MKKSNIMIVEDDSDIREGVRILLEGEGFAVEEADNGHECLRRLTGETDLVILDVMMPGISGIKTCEEIRKVSKIPILFLTAKTKESDKLLGFMAGGDDYLVKPFSYSELLARVKALLRRRQVYDRVEETVREDEEWLERKDIRISAKNNEVFLRGEEVELTEMEYKLLLIMMKNPGKIFSVQNLYENIWEEPFLYSSGNTVMVHIRRLRLKIEQNPQKPRIIQTVWGKGYRFE